jgi:hypothetical protein
MDGAMRDRLVWSGDMGISTLTVLCGTFDNQYLTGSCEQSFRYQQADGSIPIAVPAQGKGLTVTGTFGPPPSLSTQDYTMMQVTDSYQYWMFSGDTAWLKKNWPSIRAIMIWLAGQVGPNGLMSGAGPLTTQMSTNAHYYGCLRQAEQMAAAAGDTASAAAYASLAPAFGKTVNSLLFNPAAGMYSASTTQPAVFDEIGNGYALLPALDPSIDTATLAGQPDQGAGRAEGPVRVLGGGARRKHRTVRNRLGIPRPARRRADPEGAGPHPPGLGTHAPAEHPVLQRRLLGVRRPDRPAGARPGHQPGPRLGQRRHPRAVHVRARRPPAHLWIKDLSR